MSDRVGNWAGMGRAGPGSASQVGAGSGSAGHGRTGPGGAIKGRSLPNRAGQYLACSAESDRAERAL